MVSLRAPTEEVESRKPVHVVGVIDRSGSMSGEKLQLCKVTLNFLTTQLKRGDTFSLVTYDNQVKVELRPRVMDSEGKASAQRAIENVVSGGSTNLSGGLFEGVSQTAARAPEDITAVLLLTDGHANHGITDVDGILSGLEGCLHSVAPAKPTVFSFGYGPDHNADLLRAVADKGNNGQYYFVETNEDVAQAFADCLGGLTSVAGQNVKLSLRAAQGAAIKRVLTKYATRQPDAATAEVSLNDMYTDEERDILVVLALPALASPQHAPAPILEAGMECFHVAKSRLERLPPALAMVSRPAADLAAQAKIHVAVDKHYNRFKAAEAMDAAAEAARRGDLARGRMLVQRAKMEIADSVSREDALCMEMCEDLDECAEGMEDDCSYEAFGGKMMNCASASHWNQRACSRDVSAAYAQKKGVARKKKGGYATKSKKQSMQSMMDIMAIKSASPSNIPSPVAEEQQVQSALWDSSSSAGSRGSSSSLGAPDTAAPKMKKGKKSRSGSFTRGARKIAGKVFGA